VVRAANYGGFPSPPAAARLVSDESERAKCAVPRSKLCFATGVQTIFNIEHISVKVNDLWAASRSLSRTEFILVRGSAAKLNGNFQQKLNFWFSIGFAGK
jgi:hypothetical protein